MTDFRQAQGPRSRGPDLPRRIARLEAASRQRAMTDAEVIELEQLLYAQRLRQRRLPVQIAACEAKLLRLRSELATLT